MVYKEIREVPYVHDNVKEWRKNHQNIHLSMNGKLKMTWKEYTEIQKAIAEAKSHLEESN